MKRKKKSGDKKHTVEKLLLAVAILDLLKALVEFIQELLD